MTSRAELRLQAQASGLSLFDDPNGCKHGHTVFYTSTGACKLCAGAPTAATFTQWADKRGLKGWAREIANEAWLAAKGGTPKPKDRVLEAIRQSAHTSESMAATTGITVRYARMLLTALEREGEVSREGGTWATTR